MRSRRPLLLGVAGAAGAALVLLTTAAGTPEPERDVLLTFTDPAITESSGLVARDGALVTVNDSGDTGRVFVVDESDGETIGVVSWAGDPVDVEALTPARDGEVWVGDIGDNSGVRDSVEVLRVPVGRGDVDVDPARFELVYPDAKDGEPGQDAEALLADPATGRLVVVTKGLLGGRFYQAPVDLDPDRPNELRERGVAPPLATDGAFFPDGRHLVVRGYDQAVVYSWPDLAEVGSLALPDQQQGEGIAVDPQGRVLISSEGADAEVLQVALPGPIAREVSGAAEPTPGPTVAPGDDPTVVTDEAGPPQRSSWPFWFRGLAGVLGLVVLLRSMRPR